MKGQIRQRGNTYSVIVPLGKDASGKKRYKWVTCRTKREAQAKLAQLVHQVNTGQLANVQGTLGEYMARWFAEYVTTNLSPTTAEAYSKIINTHVIPALGKTALRDLRPEHLQRFYSDRLTRGLSAVTVRHFHMLLHKAFDCGVKWGILQRNLADSVSPPRNIRHEMKIPDENDMVKILTEVQSGPYSVLIFLALMTGLRRSELLGLRWSDINLAMAELSVTRSLHQLKNREMIYRPPKTAKSRRSVALSPVTCQALRDHLQATMDMCSRQNIRFDNDRLVFCHDSGAPLRPDSISQAWHRITTKLGFNDVRFHDIRHYHASILLKQGIHPKLVQERLGHANIGVTLDTYSHVLPGLHQAVAEKIDSFIDIKNSKRIARSIMLSGDTLQ